LFPTPRIGRTFVSGARIVPSSPSRHTSKEGRTRLFGSLYSPFLIRTAFMTVGLRVFSGSSCFGFCVTGGVVSMTAFWMVMFGALGEY